jgi:hypothetical protein
MQFLADEASNPVGVWYCRYGGVTLVLFWVVFEEV